MSEDLRTDHVKLESPSILTKNLFLPGHWGGLVYASAPRTERPRTEFSICGRRNDSRRAEHVCVRSYPRLCARIAITADKSIHSRR